MVEDDGHFSANNALLIKDPILEDEVDVSVLAQAKVIGPDMKLRLRSQGTHCLNPPSPILLGYIMKLIR